MGGTGGGDRGATGKERVKDNSCVSKEPPDKRPRLAIDSLLLRMERETEKSSTVKLMETGCLKTTAGVCTILPSFKCVRQRELETGRVRGSVNVTMLCWQICDRSRFGFYMKL